MRKHPYELKLLLSFLPYGVIQRDSIKMIMGSNWKYAYVLLKQMEKNRYVRKSIRTVKGTGRYAYSMTCYYLTVKGLSHIHELLFGPASSDYFDGLSLSHDAYDFLISIPDAISSFAFSPDAQTCGFEYMSRNSTSALSCCRLKTQEAMLELANVISNPIFTAPYSDLFQTVSFDESVDKSTMDDVEMDDMDSCDCYGYCEAEKDCEAENRCETEKNCEAVAPESAPVDFDYEGLKKYGTFIAMILHKAYEIYTQKKNQEVSQSRTNENSPVHPLFIERKYLQRNLRNANDVQYSLSQCNGIVLREQSPILTFHTGLAGTAWSRKGTSQLIDIIRQMLSLSKFDHNIVDGILFCKNTSQFRNAILDKAGKRQRGKQFKQVELGDGLHHLYCVIEIPEAAFQLRMVIGSQNPKEKLNYSLTKLIQGMSQSSDPLFPLYSEEGERCFNGLLMDVREINRLAKLVRANDTAFSIICFDWQEKYYQSIFPQIPLIKISET